MKTKEIGFIVKFQDHNTLVLHLDKNSFEAVLHKSTFEVEYFDEDEELTANDLMLEYWYSFEEALSEVYGVAFALAVGNVITIVKDPLVQNWGRIIEDVSWTVMMFLGFDEAIQFSKNWKNKIGKPIKIEFSDKENNLKK